MMLEQVGFEFLKLISFFDHQFVFSIQPSGKLKHPNHSPYSLTLKSKQFPYLYFCGLVKNKSERNLTKGFITKFLRNATNKPIKRMYMPAIMLKLTLRLPTIGTKA